MTYRKILIHNGLLPRAVFLPIFEKCFASISCVAGRTSTQFRVCQVQFVQDPACLIGIKAASGKSFNHLIQAKQDGTEVVRRRQVQVADPGDPLATARCANGALCSADGNGSNSRHRAPGNGTRCRLASRGDNALPASWPPPHLVSQPSGLAARGLLMKMAVRSPAQRDRAAHHSSFLYVVTKFHMHSRSPANVVRRKTKNHTLGAPQNLECRPHGSTQADPSTRESGSL